MAVLIGAAANSSSRDHCTRTVRPGWRMAMNDGIECGIVGGVVAIGAGALAVEHVDLRGGQAQRAGEPLAQHRGPCECDQTLSAPSLNSASAQEVAIEP